MLNFSLSLCSFPDDIQEELSKIPETSHAHPKRAMTFGSSQRPKVNSRYSDEGTYIRDSMRIKASPKTPTRLRKVSNPDRPGSIRSVMSTVSEPDRYSYRKSSSSVQSFLAANRRSQSESTENPNDQISDLERCRSSYRDSGLGMGRNSQRFSMEETRRKITALETLPTPPLTNSNAPSKSSTPYSSPASTPLLERAEKTEQTQVILRERDSRECRDSAYASGRFHRKGGSTYQGIQGIFSLGEEELSPDQSPSTGSPTSPVFLSDVLDEPSFNNHGKKVTPEGRKMSLPTTMMSDTKAKDSDRLPLQRALSSAEAGEKDERINKFVKKAFLTWEEVTWPHWDPNATEHEMPDHETIL